LKQSSDGENLIAVGRERTDLGTAAAYYVTYHHRPRHTPSPHTVALQ